MVKNEEMIAVAQLLAVIRDLLFQLEKAQRERNIEKAMQIKREILSLQQEIERKIS